MLCLGKSIEIGNFEIDLQSCVTCMCVNLTNIMQFVVNTLNSARNGKDEEM